MRLLTISFAATTLLTTAATAATPERIRGSIQSIGTGSMVVHTTAGPDVTVGLSATTRYSKVIKADLANVDKDSYIGTATKEVGGKLIALEVVVFPPAMRGAGEGHYGWDRIADTTLAGGGSASSTMTNGNVSAVSTVGGSANTTMTNGNVSAASNAGNAKQLTVTYKGGQQAILVPPTAPIVTFQPATMADVAVGNTVFIVANNDESKLTANSVSIGTPGVNPPM